MTENAVISEIQSHIQLGVAESFISLGGDYREVVACVQGRRLNDWINEQKSWAAGFGAVLGMVGARSNKIGAAAMLTTDMMYLLNRATRCCWGIGAIMGCEVFPQADILQIWNRWLESNETTGRLMAVSGKFASTANTLMATHRSYQDFYTLINQAQEDMVTDGFITPDDAWSYGLAFCNVPYFTDQSLNKLLQYSASPTITSTITGANALKTFSRSAGTLAATAGLQLSLRLAGKIGLAVGTKVVGSHASQDSRLIEMVAGGIASFGINLWVMNGITNAAIEYYSAPIVDLP